MCRSFWMVQLNVQGASPRPWKDQRGKLAPPGSRRMYRRKRQHRAWTGSSYGVCDGTEKKMSESTAAVRRHHDQIGVVFFGDRGDLLRHGPQGYALGRVSELFQIRHARFQKAVQVKVFFRQYTIDRPRFAVGTRQWRVVRVKLPGVEVVCYMENYQCGVLLRGQPATVGKSPAGMFGKIGGNQNSIETFHSASMGISSGDIVEPRCYRRMTAR